MTNYDELVKTLRKMHDVSIGLAAIMPQSSGDATAKLYNDAADAIEKLQKELMELKMLTCSWYLGGIESNQTVNDEGKQDG